MKTLLIPLLLIVISCGQSAATAEEKPVFEYGLAIAGLYYPHYLGAEQQSAYVFPVPYFVYRGKKVRADRSGVRGVLYDSDRLDLRISGSGSLPVSSSDNDAREGMEDLDWMIEVGPTLQYQIFKSDKQLLRLDLPVRAAFTLGSDFMNHQGWTANPRLHYEVDLHPWGLTTTLGAVFSDRRYHGYIYDVNRGDVQDERPFYQSASGFTATRFSTGLKRRFGDYFVGTLISYYDLNGAANTNSPLLKQEDYFSVSVIVAWVFGESKKSVEYSR